jgi:hypothetical protein
VVVSWWIDIDWENGVERVVVRGVVCSLGVLSGMVWYGIKAVWMRWNSVFAE